MTNVHGVGLLHLNFLIITKRINMKYFLFLVAIATFTMTTPVNADDVGVSVSVGQPGFYGRLDIGGYPQPRVVYREPMVIERTYDKREPIYLRVPPAHSKNWGKHCNEYNACGERVYFVQDNWYNREYAPRYRKQNRGHDDDNRDRRNDRQNYAHDRGRN
jgi:hypothetical protein